MKPFDTLVTVSLHLVLVAYESCLLLFLQHIDVLVNACLAQALNHVGTVDDTAVTSLSSAQALAAFNDIVVAH
jgi:hypothetical protein